MYILGTCNNFPPFFRGCLCMYFVFCRLYPSSPSHHGSVWILPVNSLLLTNTVSSMRAGLIIWWERFRGTQKEDDRGPLSIQSSVMLPVMWTMIDKICGDILQTSIEENRTFLSERKDEQYEMTYVIKTDKLQLKPGTDHNKYIHILTNYIFFGISQIFLKMFVILLNTLMLGNK